MAALVYGGNVAEVTDEAALRDCIALSFDVCDLTADVSVTSAVTVAAGGTAHVRGADRRRALDGRGQTRVLVVDVGGAATLERVVVLDEVGAEDAPVCGINLGPFLSWLNCMPAIPEERAEEEDYDPTATWTFETPSK